MMTHAQRRVYDYLRSYTADHGGIAPSMSEIATALALKGKGNVHRLLAALEERGSIRRMPRRARAIEVIPEPSSRCARCARVVPLDRYGPHNARLFVVERIDDQAKLVPMEPKP